MKTTIKKTKPKKALSGDAFALVDRGLFGLDLFRVLPRRGREKARKKMFEVEAVHDGRRLRVVGPYTLGPDDLAVLLGVLALGGLMGKPIEAANSEASRVAIVDGLQSEGEVVHQTHVRIRTTFGALCREAGLGRNTQAYERITESLWRMAAMSYADLGPVCANSRSFYASGSQRLLSFSNKEAEGEATIVLNARFAAVVLGETFFGRVDLEGSRSLDELARMLHMRLSLTVRQGNKLTIPLDDLVSWVYGEEVLPDAQQRKRRHFVRAAMGDLNKLPGWSALVQDHRPMVVIERDARVRPNQDDAQAASLPQKIRRKPCVRAVARGGSN
ncbi:MAG: hypothetical protein K2X00_12195 [Nitrospiraceae bacterium]|nr:hypothetical protein [Nitrospiraceae bacterium]